MLQKWKSMAGELDTTVRTAHTPATTTPTTTTTVSFQQLQFMLRQAMDRMRRVHRRRMRYHRRRMRLKPRHRQKRDTTPIRTKTIKGIISHPFNVTNDNNTIETKGGFFSAPGNHSSPFIADTLTRTKRRLKFAKVVPYLVFAAGEYYSLFDPDGIRLALQRNGKLPLAKKSKPIPVEQPRGGPWRMSKNMIPVESTTAKGTQLSPADTSAMALESDHRVKSFIIFFVAITGVVTVITVLLIVAMHGKGEAQSGADSQQRNNNRQCWDGSVQQQESLLGANVDPVHGRCPVCHDHEEEESQSETTDQITTCEDDETDDNDNCQTNNTKSVGAGLDCHVNELPAGHDIDSHFNRQTGNEDSSAICLEAVVEERDGIVIEDQFSVKRLGSVQQYQPCLHGDLLASRLLGVGSRPSRGPQISQVRASSSHDLLKIESTTAISGNTDNTLNNISTSNNINTNNNYIDYMAVKLRGRQDDDCQTTRVMYSRNGGKAKCQLFSRLVDCRPGYNLHDQVYLYVARCQFFDSLQQHKLTRHRDISAVALAHHKKHNATTSHSNISQLAKRHDDISPYLCESESTTFNSHDDISPYLCESESTTFNSHGDISPNLSESTTFNSHGNSSLQSTSMPLTLSVCDSDGTKRATQHLPKVRESSALTNSIMPRSNSCRNSKPALNEKNSQLRPARRRPVSYKRQRQDRSLNPTKAKLTLPDKPNFGKSSSHDRLLTMCSAINSSGITGNTDQQKAWNALTSSAHAARTLSAPNMPRRNTAEKSKNESANRGSHHTGNTSERADSDSTQLTRPVETSEPGNDGPAPADGMETDWMYTTAGPQAARDANNQADAARELEAPEDEELVAGVPIPTSADLVNVLESLENENRHLLSDKEQLKRIHEDQVRKRFFQKREQPGDKPATSVAPSAVSDSQQSDSGNKKAAKKQGEKDKKDKKEKQQGKSSGKKSPTSASSSPSSASQRSDVAIKKKDKKGVKRGGKPKAAGKKRPAGFGKRRLGKAARKSKRTRRKRRGKGKSTSGGMTAGISQTLPIEDHSQLGYFGPVSIGGLATDDALVVRRLQERKELPFNRYTSLSVILKAPDIDEKAPVEDRLMVVRKTDINPMQMTTLQPLHHSIPYYISAAKRKKRLAVGKDRAYFAGRLPIRLPPETLGDALQEQCLLGEPSHLSSAPEFHFPGQKWSPRHIGVEWPVKYANKPPFSSPGYNCKGVKQPVGVAPIVPVPWKPEYGIVGTHKIKVPTWVSPLYKPYGIGGHLGLEDPFAEAAETELYNISVPQKPIERKSELYLEKPDVGFFQWLKNMLKINKSKEDKSRPRSRWSSIFNRKSKAQQVSETVDSQPNVVEIPNLADKTPSDAAEPVSTSVPRQTKVSFAPLGPQNQISTQSVDVRDEPSRVSIAGRPSVSKHPDETVRSSTSGHPEDTVSSSISEHPEEIVSSSVSELPPDAPRSSSVSELPPDAPRSSSVSEIAPDAPRSSSVSELPPDAPRSSSVSELPPDAP